MARMSVREQLQYIEKATINTGDDLAGADDGGVLNPEQQKEFFMKVKNQMKLNQIARIVPMTGKGIEIPTLDITGRILEPDNFTASTKRVPDTGLVSLDGKRIKAAFKLTRGALEENVEGMRFLETLTDGFAMKVANGAEEQVLYGNAEAPPAILESTYINDRDQSASTTQYRVDSLRSLFDGMIKQAVAADNVVDGANSGNLHNLIVKAKKALAPRYRQDITQLRIVMPIDLEENLRWVLAQRATQLGDMSVTEDGSLRIAGIPVVGLPLFSTSPTFSENATMTGTADQSLVFKYLDADSFIATASTIGTSAVTAYTSPTDYTYNETNGTIANSGSGAITNGQIIRFTYSASPMFILTFVNNPIVGINMDFRIDSDIDVDTDTELVVIRTRLDFKFQDPQAVVLVKNVQDALTTS